MTITIPQTPSIYNRTRVIEQPDGFYWQDKSTSEAAEDLQLHLGDE